MARYLCELIDDKMATLLIVDDDKDILEFLTYNFKAEGYKVYTATDGKEAIVRAKSAKPDLIIMDVMMPNMDGVEATHQLRAMEEFNTTIILFLTARGEEYSQLAGYNAGADDYITKPVKPKILVSKVNALLRRRSGLPKSESNDAKSIKGIHIDSEKYLVTKDGENIYLPRKEFELLSLLASNSEKVFLREEIYSKVWGDDAMVGDRTIDVHIRKLRTKIGKDVIKTFKGVGYRYESPK